MVARRGLDGWCLHGVWFVPSSSVSYIQQRKSIDLEPKCMATNLQRVAPSASQLTSRGLCLSDSDAIAQSAYPAESRILPARRTRCPRRWILWTQVLSRRHQRRTRPTIRIGDKIENRMITVFISGVLAWQSFCNKAYF
jgi:hypothetical protein